MCVLAHSEYSHAAQPRPWLETRGGIPLGVNIVTHRHTVTKSKYFLFWGSAANSSMANAELLYLRDLAEVEPPRDRYKLYDGEDIYRHVPRPQWTGLDDEIWTPRNQESDPQLEKVKALMKKQAAEDVGAEATLSGLMGPPAPACAAPAHCWSVFLHPRTALRQSHSTARSPHRIASLRQLRGLPPSWRASTGTIRR